TSTFFFNVDLALKWVIVPIIFLVIINELWRNIGNPILNISTLLFGVGYTLIPFILIIALGKLSIDEQVNFPLVLGMYLLIWTNDTFAYFSGRFFGKKPLFSRISPQKTEEGNIGGVVFTIGVSLILAATTKEFSYSFWLVAALITAPSAILGDLLESLFKRSVKVKDSGSILPGHGGILDRFDAVLFTVPFFYFWSLFYLHYIAS
ncbi:MAG: phosphatidate cytidylyltransferase, partial [Crocinitomicaceae bacterium]